MTKHKNANTVANLLCIYRNKTLVILQSRYHHHSFADVETEAWEKVNKNSTLFGPASVTKSKV